MKKKNEILYLILFLLFPIMITSFDFLNNSSSLMMQTDEALLKPQIKISQKSSGNGWLPNGTPINVEDNFVGFPQICSDGTGGAIITWRDKRSGSEYDIYAQRIDSSGNVIWTNNGVLICSANDDQFFSQICSDGAGGAIITWTDGRRGGSDIYAQRINSTGDILWTPNGTAICTAGGSSHSQICSDGAEGAIIAWQDSRAGSLRDIYVQRMDSYGNFQWTPNGTVICSADNNQWEHQICGDGAGGAIITWYDDRYAMYYYDIFAQLINSSGDVQWAPNGSAICTATGLSDDPQLCSNGAGGAIITWSDIGGIYAQLINSDGNTQWTENGTAITTESHSETEPQLCSDGAGGAIITWIDGRSGIDIYAQHINSSGNIRWVPNGTVICSANNYQSLPQICSNGAGGAIIIWEDYRSGSNTDIYAQSINSSGNVQLITNGKVICSASHDQFNSQLCYDGAGGAIITWDDYRSGDECHIYAQHINYEPTEPENGEIPFEFIITIASFVGIAVVIGIATTLIIKKRRKIE